MTDSTFLRSGRQRATPTHPRLGVQDSHQTPEAQERVPAAVGAEPLEQAGLSARASARAAAASTFQSVLNVFSPARDASSDSTTSAAMMNTAASASFIPTEVPVQRYAAAPL